MQRSSKVILTVSTASVMASLDLFIVNIAFPGIQHAFHGPSDASLSWILNAYAIVFAALPVPLGRLADTIGRKRVFIGGIILFALGSLACALSTSIWELVLFRVVQAVGAAGIIPSSLALLLTETPPERRVMAVSIWSATGSLAAAFGPPIGGLLLQLSWRWIFIVNIPIAIAAVVASLFVLRESKAGDAPSKPDIVGALLLIFGVSLLTFGIIQGNAWGWGSPRVVLAFLVAALTVAVFLRHSRRSEAPLLDLGLFRNRQFTVASSAALLFFVGFGPLLLASVLFLTEAWGGSVLKAGFEFAPGPAMATLFSLPGGRIAARVGYYRVAVVGSLMFAAAGVLFLNVAGPHPSYLLHFLPSNLLGGAGVGLVIPSLAGAITSSIPKERSATGSAIFSLARQLGTVIGVSLLVVIIATPHHSSAFSVIRQGWFLQVGAGITCAVVMAAGALTTRRSLPVADATSTGARR